VDVWPIAGDFLHENRPLEPVLARLKSSESHADVEKEGIRISMKGGLHEGVKQKTVIELICDSAQTGLEGLTDGARSSAQNKWKRADGENKTGDTPNPNAGKPLQLISYKPEPSGGANSEDIDVLRLSWKTKYACEGQKGKPDESKNKSGSSGSQSSHWGFFTWFIIM